MTQGRIFARVAWVNGRTRLIEHRQNAPLKIARCFETGDGGLEVCVMDASPGLLAGDSADYEWIVEAGAKLRVVAQGATRIHPSNGPLSRQNVRFQVASGARLELWPQSVIPFRAARFRGETRGRLEDGAQLLLLESLSAGRIARGEVFEFERVESRILVSDARGPRLCLRNRFVPADFAPRSSLGWRDATQLTNLFHFGGEKADLDAAQQILAELGAQNDIIGAVSSLSRGDIGVSMLGRRACDGHEIAARIADAWHRRLNCSSL